jgi:hypothetical protein
MDTIVTLQKLLHHPLISKRNVTYAKGGQRDAIQSGNILGRTIRVLQDNVDCQALHRLGPITRSATM